MDPAGNLLLAYRGHFTRFAADDETGLQPPEVLGGAGGFLDAYEGDAADSAPAAPGATFLDTYGMATDGLGAGFAHERGEGFAAVALEGDGLSESDGDSWGEEDVWSDQDSEYWDVGQLTVGGAAGAAADEERDGADGGGAGLADLASFMVTRGGAADAEDAEDADEDADADFVEDPDFVEDGAEDAAGDTAPLDFASLLVTPVPEPSDTRSDSALEFARPAAEYPALAAGPAEVSPLLGAESAFAGASAWSEAVAHARGAERSVRFAQPEATDLGEAGEDEGRPAHPGAQPFSLEAFLVPSVA